MGQAKDDMMEKEDNWAKKAQYEGMRCDLCGCTPPYGEREVYFETGMCGRCAHTWAKDD